MPPKRIIAVNHDPDFLALIEDLLENKQYDVTVLQLGRAALAMIAEQRPDLVIVDVHLGDMNGWDFLTTLTLDPRTADLLVLVCTFNDRAVAERRRWMQTHDITLLLKPMELGALPRAVEQIIGPAEQAERAVEGTLS
jgi:CheY-like chemotaxis protein